jgi:PAS domain S-box-containing protein
MMTQANTEEPADWLHILVIEDDPADFGLIQTYLKLAESAFFGCRLEVTGAGRLSDGLQAARDAVPDMLLLDLSLPDSSGLQTVEKVVQGAPGVPVIVLTGHDDNALAISALECGAQDYLIKGQFDHISLARAMRYALARGGLESRLQLFEEALNAAPSGIVITDVRGNIQWANPAFTQITGYGMDELLGKNPATLVKSGKQDDAFYQEMWETILSGRTWRGELVNRRKDGSLYDELLAIAPVFANDGSVRNFVATKQDISHQKRLNLEGAELLHRIQNLIQEAGNPQAGDAGQRVRQRSEQAGLDGLTRRQRQVLELIASGESSSAISKQLNISLATVTTHRRDLMRRLKVHTVVELTRFALRHGLVSH